MVAGQYELYGGSGARPRRLHGRPWPVHALLLPSVPVLALWSGNAERIRSLYPLRIASTVVAMAVLVFLIVSIVQRDLRRTAIITTTVAITATTIGYLLDDPTRPWLNLTAASTLIAGGSWVATRLSSSGLRKVTIVLNVVAFALVVANTALVLATRPPSTGSVEVELPAATSPGAPAQEDAKRSIWYIVPDRYPARAELEELGLEVEDFFQELTDSGFDVVERARANYPSTIQSLAAVWGLDYLDATTPSDGTAIARLADPAIGQLLTRSGYEYLHLGSWPEFSSTSASADHVLTLEGTGEFWTAWEGTTILPTVRYLADVSADLSPIRHARQIEHGRHQFAVLQQLAARDPQGPEFVLAHLVLPHGPYVFGSDGTVHNPPTDTDEQVREAYAEQLAHTNRQLISLISLLQDRTNPPIIVLAADEGLYPEDLRAEGDVRASSPADYSDDEHRMKMSVLAALHDPTGRIRNLGETATTINVVRAAVDAALGSEDYPPLPDVSFTWNASREDLVPIPGSILYP